VDIVIKAKSKSDGLVQNVRHSSTGPMILGRGPDSAVPLEAPGISREHLEVQVEDLELFLTDMSSNGTWLNGARMPQRRKCKIKESDLVELPGYELQLELVGATPSMPAALPEAVSTNGPRSGRAQSGARSVAISFSVLELFLLVVVLASGALLVFYFTS
jgi:pSer/pThr/pTyr-binding forkhead associated (FHA) protein